MDTIVGTKFHKVPKEPRDVLVEQEGKGVIKVGG
jgi:hypothetical protein